VNADAFRAPESPNASAPLAAQIAAALTTRDATLAAAQRMLLRELAAQADESATQTLIEIAGSRGVPVLVTDARAALAKRRNGATFMLAALGKRYDFLRDVLVGPPVGPLADALAAMKETRAAPLLASHLVNPEATDDDVRRAAAALVILATKDELPALRQFFATFRATAATEDIARAVASVGEALLRLDPKDGRVLLELALKDTMTVAAARPRLEALLASPPPTAAPAAPEKSKK
jgi:outer membrane protein assembly factor BamB